MDMYILEFVLLYIFTVLLQSRINAADNNLRPSPEDKQVADDNSLIRYNLISAMNNNSTSSAYESISIQSRVN